MSKTIQELTIKDNFMFAAVMVEPENCKGLLELILGIPIDTVVVDTEKTFLYHPEYRGIRLDVFAKDDKGSRFNVEMQVSTTPLPKRARYYHNQMDMKSLKSGERYDKLPDCYVIFICDYDPFGLHEYCSIVEKRFKNNPEYLYEDGQHTIFLSTKGTNDSETPKQLVDFLHYVGANLEGSQKEYDDPFIKQLQDTVTKVKHDTEMGDKFMTVQELIDIEKEQSESRGFLKGKISLLCKVLKSKGASSEDLFVELEMIDNPNTVDMLFDIALSSATVEEFISKANLNNI